MTAMEMIDIIIYISVLLPFFFLIVWQIKRPWLGSDKAIRRLKKRIGLPVTIFNRPNTIRQKTLDKLLGRL
jgi:hypothetical protein